MKINYVRDYAESKIIDKSTGNSMPSNLPPSDVVYYDCEDGTWVCVRPSGTEPKIKFYFGVKGSTYEDMIKRSEALEADIDKKISASE